MTVKEIHQQELTNYDRLHFRKEGMFWKAYEHSAFLLHLLGFDYQVSWNSSKTLPEGVVRVGTSVNPKELLPGLKVVVDEEKYIVLEAGRTLVDADYFEWRERMISATVSLVKTPRSGRRTIKVDPAMEAPQREEPENASADEPAGSLEDGKSSGNGSESDWRDALVDSIRRFDASGSSMQSFVMLVFSLKEEISSHDREEAVPVR